MIFAPCATIFSIQPANQTPFHPHPNPNKPFSATFSRSGFTISCSISPDSSISSPTDQRRLPSLPTPSFRFFPFLFLLPLLLLPRYLRDIYEKLVSTPIEQRSSTRSTFLTCRRNRGARNRDEIKGKVKIARNLGAIRVYLAAKIDGFGARFSRRKEPRRISRDEGQTSLRFPSAPPASFRPILGSRRKPRSVCDVVASVSSPNTQHPDKYEIPSTKHEGASSLPLSLSRGAKEGRGRATPVVALHSRRREGKNPPVYQESSGRNGDREREKKGISTPRLAFRASHSRRARSIVGIYFDSRFVSFNSSPSASIFWLVPYWRSNIIRGIDRKLITTRRGLACIELFESQTRRMPFLISSPDHPNIAYANGIVSAESREAWRGDERANF